MRSALLLIALAACSETGSLGSLATDAGGVDAGDDASNSGPPPPVPRATTAIAAGGSTTCVKTSSGTVKCWGSNGGGELGIGDTEPAVSAAPVAPMGLGTMQAVFGGEVAQAALDSAGAVYLWGDIFIGDFSGMEIDHLASVVPSSIEGVSAVSSVAVGRYFTCLLDAPGAVRCYGLNDHGQLGVGDLATRALPTTVAGLDAPATSISASMGGLGVCASTSSGAVYCWGNDITAPQPVAGLAGPAASVVVGRAHACALLRSGAVMCWGTGTSGELGDGTMTSSTAPVAVEFLTDVVSLAAGAQHTCAIRQEGSVLCWGANDAGQVGPAPSGAMPSIALPASFGAASVSCGLAHTCVFGTGGNVKCFGDNTDSQLGPVSATF